MLFPLRSNLPTSPLTAAHHTSRLALTLVASLLLAACGSSTPTPATPTPLPAPNLSAVNPQPYTQDTDITPLVFGNTGGDVTNDTTGCAVDTSDSKPALPTGLMVEVVTDNGKRTCRIFGTPTELVSPARMVTITATNTGGSDTATVSIIVNPAATSLLAPILKAPNPVERSYPTGASVSLVLTNTGGDVTDGSTGCDVDTSDGKPDLPADLDVEVVTVDGKRTCQITGIPDTATIATNYEITATNVTGSSTVTVSIAVISGIASFAPPEALVYTVDDSVSESFDNTSTMGGRVTDCIVPAGVTLPAGLRVDAIAPPAPGNGCTLTGTANAITAQANYTITATNNNGDASLTLNITVNPAAPDLQAPDPVAQIYTVGTQVSLVLTNDGGDVTASTGCDVDTSGGKPGLPMGLSVEVVTDDNGKRTCRITGIPSAVTPAADYVITATNVTNITNDIEPSSVIVSITVNPAAPILGIPGAVNPQIYTQHTAITNLVFTNTGGDVTAGTGCDVDTSDGNRLPTGLDVEVVTVDDKKTCRITGTPTEVVSTARMVTITATNITGSDSATFSITVNPAAPDLQTPDPQSYSTGASVNVKLDNDGGGELTECGFDINNPLPNGLMVTTNTTNDSCLITGIPNTAKAAANYEITATNITGSDSVTVSIAVISGIASFAPPGVLVYTVDDSVSESFDNTSTMGGRVTDCVVPAGVTLPAGLMINVIAAPGNGCTLTGTANAITTQANYTITATNNNGDASLTLDITVNPAAPDLLALGERSYPTGAPVNVGLTNNGGGNLTECAVNNTLPSGLSVARNAANDSCEITGTPDTVTPAANFVITATNAGGSSSATVNIAVPSGVASFETAMLVALVYEVGDSVNESFANTNTVGSRVTDCTFTGTPPAGLSVDATTAPGNGCTLTGTANAITAQANYTIDVANDNGDTTLTLNITVNPAAPILGIPGAVNPQPYTQHTTITNLVLTNTGGDVTAGTGCAVDTSDSKPELPTGLMVEVVTDNGKETCQITGIPTEAVSPARMVAITATNTGGQSSVTVSITVNPPDAPNLSAVNAQIYAPNTAIIPLVFTNTGGDVTASTGCAVDTSDSKPSLPTGLSVGVVTDNGKETCQITGMPTEAVNPARMVTITATNVTGSDAATVLITVHSGIVPDSSSAQALFRYEAGRATTRQITFTDTVGAITSCTVPDMIDGMLNGLPDGMSINPADCTISGAPSRITAETTTHTITAMHADSTTSTTTISIETYLSARPLLSNYSGVTLVAGSTVGLPIVLQNTGGMVGENGCQTSFSSDAGRPPLSSFDLVLAVTSDSSSCEIRAMNNTDPADPADPAPPATPTGTLDKAVYTIRATNDLGVSEASVTFTIIGASDPLPAPTLTDPNPNTLTFPTNMEITSIDFGLGNGEVIGICTISPALPDGLRFDRSTCQISGTPRKALAMMTTYTVTATNKTSPAATLTNTATVDITVTNAATPSLESMIDLNLTMNSNAGLPFAIANTGGSPTSCTTAPTTAGDDALASYNLTVLVADGTCVIDSLDGNGPSRTLDGGSFTITPSSGAASTLTLNLRTPITPQISAGDRSTCAINSARQLFCWGTSPGLDNPGNTSTPTLLAGNDWAQVSAGNVHTCVINTSGQLWCWGDGGFGQLGLGNNSEINIPTQVLMPMGSDQANDDWMQVSAGSEHTCAIKAAGELWCWGEGDFGRLGLGSNTDTNTPMQVGGDDGSSDWMQVSAGQAHTCAIKASGQLWCWGAGGNGQLGLGNNIDINTPMQVGGDDGPNNWTQVSAGAFHNCAINTSRELWCWGDGSFGQLGLGTNTNINTPTQVEADEASDWMQVNVGGTHTCAIKAAGQLWCWGNGGSGQLGLGDNNNADTPTQVGTAMDWTQAGASQDHTCAIKTSGQLFCWGAGLGGQLGLGSSTDTNTPTRVPGILLQ